MYHALRMKPICRCAPVRTGRHGFVVQRSVDRQRCIRTGFEHYQEFKPCNLVVNRSIYDNPEGDVVMRTVLPPNCAGTTR